MKANVGVAGGFRASGICLRLLVAGVASLGVVLATSAGCTRKKEPTLEPTQVPEQPAAGMDIDTRLSELARLDEEFASHVAALPGSDDSHVPLARQVLEDLGQILPLLRGDDQTGPFRQQLRTIQGSIAQLEALPSGMAPGPAIDSGLRAAADALESLAVDPLFAEADQGQALEMLRTKLAELDRTRRAMHRLVVADAAAQMSRIIFALTSELQKQAADEEEMAPDDDAPAVDDPELDDAGVDDAGVDDAGVDDAGVDDGALDDAGVDENGVDNAGFDDTSADELPADDEMDAADSEAGDDSGLDAAAADAASTEDFSPADATEDEDAEDDLNK